MKAKNISLDSFHTLVDRLMEKLGMPDDDNLLTYSFGIMVANRIYEASFVKDEHSKLGDAIGFDVSDRMDFSYHLNINPARLLNFLFDEDDRSTFEFKIVSLAEQWKDDICKAVYYEVYTKNGHSLHSPNSLWMVIDRFLFDILTKEDKKVLYAMCYDIKSLDC